MPTLVVGLLLTSTACSIGDVITYEIRRPSGVTATVVVVTQDTALAQALGWSAAGIPSAVISIVSADPEAVWSWEGLSDSAGAAVLPDVPEGPYRVQVRRLLSPDERQLLGDPDVLAFVTEAEQVIGASGGPYSLSLPASRVRGLVISERYHQVLRTPTGSAAYQFGQYTEIYNNADTVIYLDGKIIGRGFEVLATGTGGASCSANEHLRVDPAGLWSSFFEVFPGSGRDHPLRPGGTAVVATDAIDHSPYVRGGEGPDLTGADFEFSGNSDVDNPAVPNMVNVGLRELPLGRGLIFGQSQTTVFLADHVEVSSLPRDRSSNGNEYVRIPADHILDVMIASDENPLYPLCLPLIHSSFNTGWAHALDENDAQLATHRRGLLSLPDGRVVLQHTRSSSADFLAGARSPGSIPKQ